MSFAVLHIEKGKGSAKGLGNHIDRVEEHFAIPNADKSKTADNFRVIDDGENINTTKQKAKTSLNERIEERIKKGHKGTKALRKDAVKHSGKMQ